jgi:hypothetical protein
MPGPFGRHFGPPWAGRGWYERDPRQEGWGGPQGGPWGPREQGEQGGEHHHGHHHGHHRGGWRNITPEQQATFSTAAEVARLFAIASRSAFDNAEKQAQLRDYLERSRKELSDLIYGAGQTTPTEGAASEGSSNVEQA